jgi:hemerythrin
MTTVTWSTKLLLGVPAMDEAHKCLVDELERLSSASDEDFPDGFFALIAALEHDFKEEEALIELINFPDPQTHRADHERALNGLLHVSPLVRQGDIAAGRKVVTQLPQWFLNHLSTLDLMLAIALDMANSSKCPPPPVFLRTERARMLNFGAE